MDSCVPFCYRDGRVVKTALLHVCNHVSSLLPQTHAFAFRRWMYSSAGAVIGRGARICGGAWIQYPNVAIGAGTWIGRRSEFASTLRARITIGDACDISQDVLFVTGTHAIGPSSRRAGPGSSDAIIIGDGVWVGARATFLGGSAVGNGSIVAAGALVRDSFPENVLIAGVPARIVKNLDADSGDD